MEDYGLPTWGSYLIFAVATIFFGALLGLVCSWTSLFYAVIFWVLGIEYRYCCDFIDLRVTFQIIVFCIDFFYPPKVSFGTGSSEGSPPYKQSKDSGDEEVSSSNIEFWIFILITPVCIKLMLSFYFVPSAEYRFQRWCSRMRGTVSDSLCMEL